MSQDERSPRGPESTPSEATVERIGSYRILEVLGEGGMGTVYLAEQKEPVRRRVALKVIKLGMDSKQVLHRFEAERQALAMMEHSSIARVLDAGATRAGRPYFAMEYVKGIPLCNYCDEHRLRIRARLDLFQKVCSGVQHAHQKGVIHRDLKPGNILVAQQDDEPRAKIIDFGLARATDHRMIAATIYTQQGETIGTPEYMSPEQAGLSGLDIDTRTDVYSLGVILYELLTGELPFSSAMLQTAGFAEVQRMIREDDPPRPSARLNGLGTHKNQVATLRQTEVSSLLRRLHGDLDWVVMKALEKDRARRYQTATELAQDIQRFLEDAHVLATPPSLRYRTGKLLRRYRSQVIAAALVLITLLVGIASTTFFWVAARTNLDRFDLVAIGQRLDQAEREEAGLYPAWHGKIEAIEAWTKEKSEPLKKDLPKLRQALAELAAQPTELNDAQRFLRDHLQTDADRLESFLISAGGTLARVEHALTWAKAVQQASTTAHEDKWDEARHAIRKADGIVASEAYAAVPIDLEPQCGLVPIGPNPVTKLWEFYHLRSAWDATANMDPAEIPIPEHNDDGSITMTEATGIVFVLIPGAWFEPGSFDGEAPPKGKTLEAYFLARHELTQGQYGRLSEFPNPSHNLAGEKTYGRLATLANPVEQVSYVTCIQLMAKHGLIVPTEAQWEYACRAGTVTGWSTGDTLESLQGHANVLDEAALRFSKSWGLGEKLDDGYPHSSPVGKFLANDFGLFDMHGNVEELCRDPADPGTSYLRGGSCAYRAYRAQSGFRQENNPNHFHSDIGLRVAREIKSSDPESMN